MKLKPIFDYLLIPLAWFLLLLSYAQTEIANDVYTFIGIEKQAAMHYGSFPSNIDAVFEMKPIGNRMFWYIVNQLTPFPEHIQVPLVKLILLLFALITFWYLAERVYERFQVSRYYFISFLFFIMFAMHQLLLLQTEWVAVIFALGAIALYLSESRVQWVLAGVFMAIVFSLKGTTGFMLISLYAGFWLLGVRDWQRVKWSLVGISACLIAGVISCFTIFPHAIADVLASKDISSAFIYYSGEQVTVQNLATIFYEKWGLSTVFMPALALAGLFSVYLLFVKLQQHENKKWIAAYLVMWSGGFISSSLALEFFPYQYITLFPALVVTFILIYRHLKPARCIALMTGITIFCTVLFILFASIWTAFYPSMHAFNTEITNQSNYLKKTYHLNEQPTLLFLDSGVATYFFTAPSACRYPHVMQFRRVPHPLDQAYFDELNCVADYKGQYAIGNVAWWSDENVTKAMAENYTVVYHDVWDVMERKG